MVALWELSHDPHSHSSRHGGVVALLALPLCAIALGTLLPESYPGSASVTVDRSPDAVWPDLTNPQRMPLAGQARAVRVVSEDPLTWTEDLGASEITVSVVERLAGERLVLEATDSAVPMRTRLEATVRPDGAGTRVDVSQLTTVASGGVLGPVFRGDHRHPGAARRGGRTCPAHRRGVHRGHGPRDRGWDRCGRVRVPVRGGRLLQPVRGGPPSVAGQRSLRRWGAGASGRRDRVVTVLRIDGDRAWVGDLADEPIPMAIEDLAAARARIRKHKHRLLRVSAVQAVDLGEAVRAGIAACRTGLLEGRMRNFTLDAFATWAERLRAGSGKDSWARMFPRGKALWQGLAFGYEFIEKWHSGGGNLRPLFASFLDEAATALDDRGLAALSERYAAIGRQWTALAEAMLPEDVPGLARTRHLVAAREEAFVSGGASAAGELREAWAATALLAAEMAEAFPLSDAEVADLLADLAGRVEALHREEVAACEALGRWA